MQGESRRGLGLVCEPETRLARASKIQQTSRAVLRMHAEGASAARLARRDNNSSNSGRRRIVLGGATVDNLMCWSPMQVAAWVRTDVGIPARAEAFVEHAIGGAVLII